MLASEAAWERGSRRAAERGSLAGENEERGSSTPAADAPDRGSLMGAGSASFCLDALLDLLLTVAVSTLCRNG